MLGFLNPVKTAIYCAAAAGALALAGAGYLHYKGLRSDLDAERAKAARLEVLVAVQSDTIDTQSEALREWQDAGRRMQEALGAMAETARAAGEETRRLHALFSEHDLGALAASEPARIEARIDAGTERMRRLLECASGSGGEDCPG